MTQFSAYIFDLDGTLLDTLADLHACVNHTLKTMNYPLRTRKEVRRFLGNGQRNLLTQSLPHNVDSSDIDRALDIFKQYYLEHGSDLTTPYEGINDMLSELKKRGKRLAVVSNKFCAATQKLVAQFFPGVFEVVLGEDGNIRRKPSPDMVIEAMRQLGVSSDDAVYVGDSEVDILTACNAGLPCISVEWGFRDRDFLIEKGATDIISTPQELIDYKLEE